MSKQVLDREQMKHLNELGLDISNASCYIWEAEGKEYLYFGKCEDINGFPTFTLHDILDLLPSEIEKDGKASTLDILKHPQNYIICFWNGEPLFRCENRILIDAAYEMLCWCIENGYVKTNKEN